MRSKFLLALSVLFISISSSVWAEVHGVSVGTYNVFNTDSKILKLVFPPSAPIDGKPIFSKDQKTFMLRFKKSADGKRIDGVVETETGSYTLSLLPSKNLSPQVVRITGLKNPLPEVKNNTNPNAEFIPVLASIAQGETPKSYQKIKVNEIIDYGNFLAYPVKAYSNNEFNVVKYKLVLKEHVKSPVVLDASQFYRQGIRASMPMSNLRITKTHPAYIVLVSEVVDG